MKITRTSPFTGAVNTQEIDITEEQALRYIEGAFLQDAFPNLTEDEREFIHTGITKEEWDKYIGTEENNI